MLYPKFSKFLFIFIISLIYVSPSQAVLSVQSAKGISNFIMTTTGVEIYASFTDSASATTDTTNTCEGEEITSNNTSFRYCNKTAVSPSGKIEIFIVDSDRSDHSDVKLELYYTEGEAEDELTTTQISTVGGITLYFDWPEVCDALEEDCSNTNNFNDNDFELRLKNLTGTSTESLATLNIRFAAFHPGRDSADLNSGTFVDGGTPANCPSLTNTSGLLTSSTFKPQYDWIYDFQTEKGDETVYINLFSDPGLTSAILYESDEEKIEYLGIEIFYREVSQGPVLSDTPGSDPANNQYETIGPQNNDASFQSKFDSVATDFITNSPNLINGRHYVLRMASLDRANNLSHFTGACQHNAHPQTTTSDHPYYTQPELLSGLFTEDVNCFVATTVTQGNHPFILKSLRLFRNKHLLSNIPGTWFVIKYYKWGPFAARWIQDKPLVKATLLPGLYGLSFVTYALSLDFAPILIVFYSVFLGLLLLVIFIFSIKPKKPKAIETLT